MALKNLNHKQARIPLEPGQRFDPEVRGLVFSPDAELLITGCTDGMLRVWNVAEERFERMLTGLRGATSNPTIVHQRYVAAADFLKNVIVWDYQTGEMVQHWHGYTEPALAAYEDRLFVSDGEMIRLFNVGTGQSVEELQAPNHVSSLDTTPDGRILIIGDDEGVLHVWDRTTRQWTLQLQGTDDYISEVSLSTDGRWLSACADTTLVWDVGQGICIQQLPESGDIAFLPNSCQLALVDGTNLTLWNAVSGVQLGEDEMKDPGGCLTVSNDGRWLATGGWDGNARIWQTPHLSSDVPEGERSDIRNQVYQPKPRPTLRGLDASSELESQLASVLNQLQTTIHEVGHLEGLDDLDFIKLIVDGKDALEVWGQLQAACAETGRWPVVVGDDNAVTRLWEEIRSYQESLESDDEQQLSLRGQVDVWIADSSAESFETWLKNHRDPEWLAGDYLRQAEQYEQLGATSLADFYRRSADEVRTIEVRPFDPSEHVWPEFEVAVTGDLSTLADFGKGHDGEIYDRAAILLLPTTAGWEAPAFLYFGDFNACPKPSVHVAMARWAAEKFGAHVAAIQTGAHLEFECFHPPATREQALHLARDLTQFAEAVTMTHDSLGTLASALKNGAIWTLWWD